MTDLITDKPIPTYQMRLEDTLSVIRKLFPSIPLQSEYFRDCVKTWEWAVEMEIYRVKLERQVEMREEMMNELEMSHFRSTMNQSLGKTTVDDEDDVIVYEATETPTTTTTETTSALTASSPLLTNSLGLTSDHQLMKDIMDLLGETPEEDQEILTKIKLATSSMWTQEILETEMDGTFPASSKSDSGACAWTSGQLTLDNDGWYNSAHSPFRYNTTS